ncbi:hypothetical protein [uncultured Roseobacter sp.]|uniref:hypothetical protein n=1 Tax=uncultured Roseobacter sp. TaxID=114847 RepID=UPI00262FAA7B|nr:hypothetical protein [uncultured Roseobacter sp.]
MRRILMLVVVTVLALVLFYLSHFWFLSLWDRAGLFGQEALRPQGDLLSRWLRGTQAAPFDLVIWAIGCFVILSGAQKLHDLLSPSTPSEPSEDP